MNLKEAFRFQNKLGNLMESAIGVLAEDSNVTKTETTLLQSKVIPGAVDEVSYEEPKRPEYASKIEEVIRFMLWVIEERERLYAAIRKTKYEMSIDMDSQKILNSKRREISTILKSLLFLKESDKTLKEEGVCYTFDSDGIKEPHFCDMRKVVTLGFDRDMVKKYRKEVNSTADGISAELDLVLLTAEVDYEPPFDVNTSFDEAFGEFLQSLK